MSTIENIVAAIALALLLSVVWDGPSEIQAITDVQAEVNQLSGVQQ